MIKPSLPLPEPLRAAEVPSFTNTSVVVRLPNIARRVLTENHLPPEAVEKIQTLIAEIPDAPVRLVELPLAAHAEEWADHIRPYIGQNWLEIPWFFAEEYFYVRILEATGYFTPGDGLHRDPYAAQKQLGLLAARKDLEVLAQQVRVALALPEEGKHDAFSRLLLVDLWGNQNDLSMWPVRQDGEELSGGSAGAEIQSAEEHVLADDRSALLEFLDSRKGRDIEVVIVLDNAGYELAADLALADFLLESKLAARVVLHTKSHPVFVSDALNTDVHTTLDTILLSNSFAAKEMAVRLRISLLTGQLRVRHHPFWTSPLPLWEMPDDLLEELRTTDLLISKGDANYRRLLDDRHWPIDLPFQQVVGGYPFGVLALRTLKSEIAVGISPENVPADDPDWMINGRWGLIQFSTAVQ